MIYITLCAMPDRLANKESSEQCLLALLNQNTDIEYRLILNVPLKLTNYDNSDIPNWVFDLQKQYDHKFIILRKDEDYGPITNILYPIKYIDMDQEDIIIVCDDDHEYDKDMISFHLKKLEQYPDYHAICFRGNNPLELRTWHENDIHYGKFYPSCVLFPTRYDIYLKLPDHWHSVSYRRKFIHDDIFDSEFLGITWNNDILMGVYAWVHNFYFLCAHYEKETDFRPVNYDGRGANSFPIKKMLSFDNRSGCNKWREKNLPGQGDLWNHAAFNKLFNIDKGIIKLW